MKFIALSVVLLFRLSLSIASDSTKVEVYFEFNKFNLSSNEATKIDSVFKAFDAKENTLKSILVFGHTDQIGSNSYNDTLSQKRAETVVDFLKNIGIKIELMNQVVGFGKHQLKTTLMDENNRAFNRRVEITIFYDPKKKVVVEKIIETPKPNAGNDIDPIPQTQKLSEKIKDSSLKVGDNIVLPYILFVGGEHTFVPIAYPYLDELLDVMNKNPMLEIEIQGHVCCTSANEKDGYDFGTGKWNLSEARAKAVYDFLKKNNMASSRMDFNGYGHKFPITQEKNEEEKARNRRVEIKIKKK